MLCERYLDRGPGKFRHDLSSSVGVIPAAGVAVSSAVTKNILSLPLPASIGNRKTGSLVLRKEIPPDSRKRQIGAIRSSPDLNTKFFYETMDETRISFSRMKAACRVENYNETRIFKELQIYGSIRLPQHRAKAIGD